MSGSDISFMARAIELAKHGRFTTTPNPNVGCVIVNQGKIVGEGFHRKAGEGHAEVNALAQAGRLAEGATAYVTLEPCSHFGKTPPCADALIKAGIKRVVAAMRDPNPRVAGRGLARLAAAGVEISDGLLAQDAEALNLGFFKRMRTGMPFVQLKLAASLDGRTALASGESKWITSPQARSDVQAFRAESCAILSTSATVLADDPSLTVRYHELPHQIQAVYPESALRQPKRIIIDSQNRVTPAHRLVQQAGETWLMRSTLGHEPWPLSVKQQVLATKDGKIALPELMHFLGDQQLNRVWIEAGAGLAGALLQAHLVDELIVYIAPKLLGSDARGLCQLTGLSQLSQAPCFDFTEITQVGPDLRLRLRPQQESQANALK